MAKICIDKPAFISTYMQVVHVFLNIFLHLFGVFFLNFVRRDVKAPKKTILTSRWCVNHPFASGNTQQEGIEWLFYVAGPEV